MMETELFKLNFYESFQDDVKSFQQKKKKSNPCVGVLARLLLLTPLGPFHRASTSSKNSSLWDPSSYSGFPARRSKNPPGGPSTSYFLRCEHTYFPTPWRIQSYFTLRIQVLLTTCLWKPLGISRRLSPSSLPPFFPASSNLKTRSPSSLIDSACPCVPGTSRNRYSSLQ